MAKIGSDRKILPYILFFDISNKVAIVNSYTLDEGACPFLKDNKCSIYEKRPVICRTFPFLFNVLDILFSDKQEAHLPKNVFCEFEKGDRFLDKLSGTRMEILGILRERYSDSYFYQMGFSLFNKAVSEFLTDLEGSGKIRLVKDGYDGEDMAKMIESSKSVNISEFYKDVKGVDISVFFIVDRLKDYLNDKAAKFYHNLAK